MLVEFCLLHCHHPRQNVLDVENLLSLYLSVYPSSIYLCIDKSCFVFSEYRKTFQLVPFVSIHIIVKSLLVLMVWGWHRWLNGGHTTGLSETQVFFSVSVFSPLQSGQYEETVPFSTEKGVKCLSLFFVTSNMNI